MSEQIIIPQATIIPPFKSGETTIDGRTIKGRPVQWDKKPVTADKRDADGEYIKPTLYEAQCPYCCLRIEFAAGFVEVQCPRCNKGKDVSTLSLLPEPFCNPGEFDEFGYEFDQ